MRPGQNKRMRGRPSNNRRGPNPLTRSYESNGPDVKIRGNAHHIAEKYLQLARDAHTSGDPVAAENYLQHAEHYFRLIAAAQAAQFAAQGRPPGEIEAEEEEEDDGGVLDRFASPPERAPPPYNPPQGQPYAGQPQPNPNGYNGQPFEGGQPPHNPEPRPQYNNDRNNYQPRNNDRPQHGNRDNRPPRPPYGERNDNSQREYRGNDNGQREGQREYRGQPDNRPSDNRPSDNRPADNRPMDNRPPDNRPVDNRPREYRNNYRDMNPQREPQPVVDAPVGLPSFITAAPRVPPAPEILEQPQPVIDAPARAPAPEPEPLQAEAPPTAAADEGAEARAPRGRRRRVRSPYGFQPAGAGEEAEPPAAPENGTPSE